MYKPMAGMKKRSIKLFWIFLSVSACTAHAWSPLGPPLEVMAKSHSNFPDWKAVGGSYISVEQLKEFPQQALDWYSELEGHDRRIGPGGQPFLLHSSRRWYGNSDGFLRMEKRSIFHGGDRNRSTTIDIWTRTEHLSGLMSQATPSSAVKLRTLSLNEEQDVWEKGRMPFVRMRADSSGYIELARYALRILDLAEDRESGINDEGYIWCRSDFWRVYVEGEAGTGEIVAVVLGLTARSQTLSRHEYQGRLSENLFPARHPRQEVHFHYQVPQDHLPWWKPVDRPQINGFVAFSEAHIVSVSKDLFEWHDPDWDRNSVHDPAITNDDADAISKSRPMFVPSKTNPGRVVPNSPKSQMKTALLALGIALLLGGGILAIRRRAG